MKVAVIGAHGVVGRVTVPALLVRGLSVRTVDVKPLLSPGPYDDEVEFFAGDILNSGDMVRAVVGCDIVLHLATAVPRSGAVMDWSKNDAIRRIGTTNLLSACARQNVGHYVQQSVSMLYAAGADRWLDEDSATQPVKALESAADMEVIVRSSRVPWTILRGGLLYGPATGRESGWMQQARDGSLRVPGDGTDYASLIHQTDLAGAFSAACIASANNRIFNIVDAEPTIWRDLFNYIAKCAGTSEPPVGGPVVFPSQRVTNHRAIVELKWKPEVPSYREGFTLIRQ